MLPAVIILSALVILVSSDVAEAPAPKSGRQETRNKKCGRVDHK
jgi:hypothetical protein